MSPAQADGVRGFAFGSTLAQTIVVDAMRTARFFVPEEWIARSAEAFTIPAGPTHKQLISVLRAKIGDPLSLMTNNGEEIDGRITDIGRSAIVGVIAGSTVAKPLRPDIVVCAAMTKRDTFEWMLQKCTELGANGFIPMYTDRVVKRPKDIPRRWRDIVREASEQSGRVTMPTIEEPRTLGATLGAYKKHTLIALHESAGVASLPTVRDMDHVAMFIGPEGGFTDPEIALMKDAGASIVKLGSLVMRAETAAVAALTLLRLT